MAILFSGLVATALVAPSAVAQETESDSPPESLGMDPASPGAQPLPGGMAPLMGEPTGPDWRFDFHGVLSAPLRVGINQRDDAQPGQSKMVLHTPPQVPGDQATFSYTSVTPMPYAQLNFSYGNDVVTGTAALLARQTSVSAAFFDPPAQSGINDLFLSVVPKLGERSRLTIRVGAFSNRYGSPGEYDEGRYGTPLIARTNGAGENVEFAHTFGDFIVQVEQGFQGQTSKAGNGLTPEGWNDFADPGIGSSFVNHVHLGGGFKDLVRLGGHYMLGWSQDERTGASAVDARMHIMAADLRLTLGRFGHFYTAYSYVKADHVRTLGRVVEVLNTRDGPGLMKHYLGPEETATTAGTGNLSIFGAQYDLSVGRLVSYPVPFSGDGPDIFVSLFGMFVKVNSNDQSLDNRPRAPTESKPEKLYDDVTKFKYGAEATYSFLPWMGAGARYDTVVPMASDAKRSYAVISPRLMFHTGWQSRDLVVLQYSNFIYGQYTEVPVGYPPVPSTTAAKDKHVISLTASMWW